MRKLTNVSKGRGIMVLGISTALIVSGCGSSSSKGSTPTTSGGEPGTAASSKGKPFVIGELFPLSGPLTAIGDQIAGTAEFEGQQINAHGGVKGRTLSFVRLDTKLDPATAVAQFTKAVTQDHVDAFIGPVTSSEAQAVIPLATRYKVPLVLVDATDNGFTQPPKQYVYRVGAYIAQDVSTGLAAMRSLGCTKPGLLYDDSTLGPAYKASLEQGLGATKLAIAKQFSSTAVQLNSEISAVQASKATCLFVASVADATLGTMVKEMDQIGYDVPVIGDADVANVSATAAAGTSALQKIKVYGTVLATPDTPNVKTAFASYTTAGKSVPGGPALPAYDAVGILAAAAGHETATGGAALAAALQDLTAAEYTAIESGTPGASPFGFSATRHDWFPVNAELLVRMTTAGGGETPANLP
jgi:branched-chain amino acid transport system substrate-binding protein